MVIDPLSAAGVALGGTSLLIQVFDGAKKGFDTIVAAVGMPENCEKYRVCLIIEYHRVLAWASAAGIIEEETGTKIAISLGADPLELLTVVSRIDILLREFIELNDRYKELHPKEGITADEQKVARVAASEEDILQKVSSLALRYEKVKSARKHTIGTNHLRASISATVKLAKHPKRLRWVLWDEKVFTAFLQDLNVQTERLRELMDDYRSDKTLKILSQLQLEMVQVRIGTQELQRLLNATILIAEYTAKSDRVQDSFLKHNDTLRDLARLKVFNVSVEKLDDADIQKNIFTAFNELVIDDKTNRAGRVSATLRTGDVERAIWIEWKPYKIEYLDPEDEKQQVHPATKKRTAALATILQLPKPDSFSTPHCLGFFDDWDRAKRERRYGWLFEMPQPRVTSKDIRSLFDIMEDSKLRRPSLNVRVALARDLACSVLYMHAVNWLHKAIRSENVVYSSSEGAPDLTKPVLSGFEYSRPTANSHTSEAGESNARIDMYRWPEIHGDVVREGRSRKTYDIYALGLVLLEIAYWQPLYKITYVGLELGEVGANAAREVRNTILETRPAILEKVRELVGNEFHSVIHRCIVAHGEKAFDVLEDEDQTNGIVGLKLQEAFVKDVVDVLQAIRV